MTGVQTCALPISIKRDNSRHVKSHETVNTTHSKELVSDLPSSATATYPTAAEEEQVRLLQTEAHSIPIALTVPYIYIPSNYILLELSTNKSQRKL